MKEKNSTINKNGLKLQQMVVRIPCAVISKGYYANHKNNFKI